MAKLPAFNPTPTRSEREYRATRKAKQRCMRWRGCTCKPGHIGPHIIMVKVRKNRPR